MEPSLIIALCILAVSIVLLVRYVHLNRKVKELSSKTSFAIQDDSLMKVTFEEGSSLSTIAQDFNAVVSKYQSIKKMNTDLEVSSKEKEAMGNKLKDFETSMSQITLLTDIGKQITGSLNIENIMDIMFSYIQSSMEVEAMELLYFEDEVPVLMHMAKDRSLQTMKDLNLDEKVMMWSMNNNKEVFLNDAQKDYGQYVFDPIVSIEGYSPAALMCIPLFIHNKRMGAFAVESKHPNVYNSYHLDFLRNLVSYLAVALDNARVYQLLEEGKQTLEEEKSKTDELLLNILPAEIAEELKMKGEAVARKFDVVSILFTDFKEFTQTSEKLSPEELVHDINHCFKAFDLICEKYGIEKIKTIGDSYMAAGGIPVPDDQAVKQTVLAGLAMNQFILDERERMLAAGKVPFEMRVGINTGPVVAGIVGVKKFQYDIWGDAVNTASRMESHGEVGKVNISQFTYDLIKDEKEFEFEHRGKISVKGKGEIDMYYVTLK